MPIRLLLAVSSSIALWLAAPALVAAQSLVDVTPPASRVSASTDDGDVAGNAVDGDLATRWSGMGDGAWIQFDLGTSQKVSRVTIAVFHGDQRRNRFDLQVSSGDGMFRTVLAGLQTSGKTTAAETFDFPAQDARVVRYLGHTATLNAGGTSPWNSLTEVKAFAAAATTGPCVSLLDNGGPRSQWVAFDATGGALVYKNLDSQGDRILDFSNAGYGGGGVALPTVAAAETLGPSGSDDSAAIQAAIDRVSARPLVNGFRGAVVLRAGSYNVSRTLSIGASGVVLRGAGSGTSGTLITLTGSPFRFLEMKGSGSAATTGSTADITDAFVPVGARTISVSGTSGFAVGDTVIVQRPVTQNWVHFMGMDTLVRNGQPQTWIAVGTLIGTDRVITAISGNQVTLDVPLTDSFDSSHLEPPGGSLVKYTWPGRISQVGVEGLRLAAPPQTPNLSDPQFGFMSIDAVIDGWVKDVRMKDCVNCMSLSKGAKRMTIQDVTFEHTGAVSAAPFPADFAVNGTQLLLNRCASLAAKNVFTVVTQALGTGPNVVLNFSATQQKAIEPHQRWATGLLLDNVTVDGDINLLNRGVDGSGHGWAIGWGVAWNGAGSQLTIQRPPGSMNWAIGTSGTVVDKGAPGGDGTPMPRGTIESNGTPVTPSSLYLAQLCVRLGPQAVHNLGY
jgi:hypothetical protein